MRRLATISVATVLLVMVVAVAVSGQTEQTYVVQDLGTLPGDSLSYATGINNLGWVVGVSYGPLGYRAFLWTPEAGMVELPGLPDLPHTLAGRVNYAGQVIGTAYLFGATHAVRWTNGVPTDLGVLGIGPYSEGYGINASGDAVGYSYYDGQTLIAGTHAFLYTDASGMTDLTPEDRGARDYAADINDSGQIAGTRVDVAYHATRWVDGVAQDLGTVDGFRHS